MKGDIFVNEIVIWRKYGALCGKPAVMGTGLLQFLEISL